MTQEALTVSQPIVMGTAFWTVTIIFNSVLIIP
jgi:hypothetical protein